MLQESVYCRIVINRESAEFLQARISSMCPVEGLVQSLIVTEKQYSSMKFLVGEQIKDIRNSSESTVII